MKHAIKHPAKILIFSPHPDDAEFAMGGTMLSLVQAHCVVHVVVMTDGGKHPLASAEERWIEQKQASEMGKYTVQCLNLPDGKVTTSNALDVCIDMVLSHRPRIVFAPFPSTGHPLPSHPDHERTGEIVREAVRRARIPYEEGRRHVVDCLLYYYIPQGITPTLLLDISRSQQQLARLWSCFDSQLQTSRWSVNLLMAHRVSQAQYSNGMLSEAFVSASPLVIAPTDLATLSLGNCVGSSEVDHK